MVKHGLFYSKIIFLFLNGSIIRIFLFFVCVCPLPPFSPNMANTVNAALKPLETLSRIVNQPSSLFGGKGGSSKNKAEHDTVGAARDSNSNTTDQGAHHTAPRCRAFLLDLD